MPDVAQTILLQPLDLRLAVWQRRAGREISRLPPRELRREYNRWVARQLQDAQAALHAVDAQAFASLLTPRGRARRG